MPAAKVEFLFDFGSLNAYFAHKVIPGIEARSGAKFEYVPILLGGVFKLTNNKPPMVAFAGIKGKMDYERLEIDRFVKRHNIAAYRFNPHFPVNTLAIMRGAVAAQMAGELNAYADAMFHHLWEAEKKLDEPDVIRASLIESGLDADRLMAAAQTPEVKQQLLNNTEAAVARGTFGSPTFFVNGEIFFGKDRLRDVEEEIQRAGNS
jgi:2-hydroxychromene-2-carboxylate isomerase